MTALLATLLIALAGLAGEGRLVADFVGREVGPAEVACEVGPAGVAGPSRAAAFGAAAAAPRPPVSSDPRPVPRLRCSRPRALRLHRFEDRSAQLTCRGRVLARIGVPG